MDVLNRIFPEHIDNRVPHLVIAILSVIGLMLSAIGPGYSDRASPLSLES